MNGFRSASRLGDPGALFDVGREQIVQSVRYLIPHIVGGSIAMPVGILAGLLSFAPFMIDKILI